MDSTISTKDLKSKLDKKQGITVVETLAPERYREAHIPGALNIPPEQHQGTCSAVVAQQGRRDHHLLHEQSLTRQRIRCP